MTGKGIIIRFLIITMFLISAVTLLSKGAYKLHAQEVNKTAITEKASDKTDKELEKEISSVENGTSGEENKESGKQEAVKDQENLASSQTKGDNLFSTVRQGGPLMIFLIMLGLAAMTIVIERAIFFTQNSVWKGQVMDEEMRKIASESGASFREDLEDDLKAYFNVYITKLEKGLALLSGIGNLAPIAGFLGTVIGMISAFASIAAATTVNAKVVAVGIQIALVTTAGGLIVAAPTLAFFYLYTHVIHSRNAQAEEVIAEVTEGMPRLSVQLKDSQV